MFLFHKKSVRSYVLKFRVYGLEAMHSVWDKIFQLTTYIIHIIKQRMTFNVIVKNMSILAMTVCTAEYSINCISRGDVSIRKQQNHVYSFVNLPTS